MLDQNNNFNLLKVEQHHFTPYQDTLAMEYITGRKVEYGGGVE